MHKKAENNRCLQCGDFIFENGCAEPRDSILEAWREPWLIDQILGLSFCTLRCAYEYLGLCDACGQPAPELWEAFAFRPGGSIEMHLCASCVETGRKVAANSAGAALLVRPKINEVNNA